MSDKFDHDLTEKPTPMTRFEKAASQSRSSLVSEFWYLLRNNKKWWLLPILLILLFVGGLMLLSTTAVAPLIYTLF